MFDAGSHCRGSLQKGSRELYENNNDKERLMKEKIVQILESLRPSLAAEGGDVELVELTEDGTVTVGMSGLCGTCHATLWTHRLRIERAFSEQLPGFRVAVQIR